MHLVVDMGGRYIRYEVVEAGISGQIDTESISIEKFLDSFINSFNIKKVGISIAGQVRDGYVVSSPNIKLRHKNLAEYIWRRWRVEAVIENNLNMAVLAEAEYWGVDNLVALYSGSGLGAGVVENSKVVRGIDSLAGEIGHIPYKEAPFRCGCGKNNCIELYASRNGIKRWIDHYGIGLSLLKEVKEDGYVKIAKEYEKALLQASAIMVNLFNPSILVLGGEVIQKNVYLINLIKQELPKYALKASTDSLKVELTRLCDAPLKGIKTVMGTR
jgi:glucokinase